MEEKKKELGVLVIESEGAKGVAESERSKNDSKSFKTVIEDIRDIAESKKISLKEALFRKVKNLKMKIIHTEEKEGSFKCEMASRKAFILQNRSITQKLFVKYEWGG